MEVSLFLGNATLRSLRWLSCGECRRSRVPLADRCPILPISEPRRRDQATVSELSVGFQSLIVTKTEQE